jgi:lipoate-protein ligase B
MAEVATAIGRERLQVLARRLGFGADAVDYLAGWELQRQVHANVVSGRAPDTVLLLEHQPVYTAGRRTETFEQPFDGTPVIDVDRGGKITWHGPGQLVGYPIVRLPEHVDLVAYVRRIVPCGISDADVTSLSREAGRDVTVAEVLPLVERRLTANLGFVR